MERVENETDRKRKKNVAYILLGKDEESADS